MGEVVEPAKEEIEVFSLRRQTKRAAEEKADVRRPSLREEMGRRLGS